jgi:hypothetical protein
MAIDVNTLLIAVIFGSQVFVLSFLVPRRRRQYAEVLFTRYPPEEFPRLYPVPREQTRRRLAIVARLHVAMGAIAAVTLAIGLLRGVGSTELARRLLCCLIAQILPTYVAMPWMIGVARAFRAMPPPSARATELRPWRIVDFVSPTWIVSGIAGQVLALTCAAVALLHRSDSLRVVLYCSVISVALLLRMTWLLLGRVTFARVDPYMSTVDTFRARQRRFRLLFGAGAAMGGYFAFVQLNQAGLVHLDFQYVIAGISVAIQVIWFAAIAAHGRELEIRDFSVYRGDPRSVT